MELVEGKTLRELLFAGALPVKRILQVAAQVADGLARAHEAGIVHRDLKPENLMVTRDGRVKILDFGLAKLTHIRTGSDEGTNLPTETGTGAGVVLGTVGYMSPEQAAAQPVDFRSDQFSFGSILYEMTTGRRAFQRKTGAETLAAIIQEDPEPLGRINSDAPPPFRWLVERCLAKEPEERYGTTRDLARDLATVRDHLSEASAPRPGAAAVGPRPRSWTYTAVAGAVALGLGLLAGKSLWVEPSSVPRFHQVTFRRGVTGFARFAPDGQTIVYSASWEGKPWELFSTRTKSLESRSLGLPAAEIYSISSKGEMAIRLDENSTLARVSLSGGAPRQILENVEQADWAPDGDGIAVIHAIEGKNRIEFPIGKVLYETAHRISLIRFSPRGDLLGFHEAAGILGAGEGEISVIDLQGKRRAWPGTRSAGDFVWSPAGEGIWFLKPDLAAGLTELHASTLAGRGRLIATLPGSFRLYDVSQDGRALMERTWFRGEILGVAPGETQERPLSWLNGSEAMDLSRDGKMVLINEWAHGAVYLRKTDGSDAVRLGEGTAAALSPDGMWALAFRGPSRFVLLPTSVGQPRELSIGDLRVRARRAARFFPDGKRILLIAEEPGRRERAYVLDIESGKTRPVTPEGTSGLVISPDGRWIAIGDSLYPVEGGDRRPFPTLQEGEFPIQWAEDGRAIYVRDSQEHSVSIHRLDLASGQRTLWREFRPSDPAGLLGSGHVLLTPDGEAWVRSGWRDLSELFVVDGIR
jgi:Tol biopolymer transport system component